jgi:hypothetical protein
MKIYTILIFVSIGDLCQEVMLGSTNYVYYELTETQRRAFINVIL